MCIDRIWRRNPALLEKVPANIFATQWTYLDGAWPDFETDVFGLACKRGDIAMMRMLLEASRT
jgi:hypothetical protein